MGKALGDLDGATERQLEKLPLFIHWPVTAKALAALVDLGMSDEAIARYFLVDPEAVCVQRRLQGITGNAPGTGNRHLG